MNDQKNQESPPTPRSVYLGLFLTALATVLFELLLTRIFSVTMWYHFAFFCVSIAMFGMTVGAVLVYLFPHRFAPEKTISHLAVGAELFAVTMVLALLTHLSLPVSLSPTLVSLYAMTLTYVVLAVPFIFSGICICLALTRFPKDINRLYAADLCGAALSCFTVVLVLRFIDGPSAVIFAALIAAAGAVAFAGGTLERKRAVLVGLVLAVAAAASTGSAAVQRPLLKLQWVKGALEKPLLFEKWNSFSRVAIRPADTRPRGAGLSSTMPDRFAIEQQWLDIDADAGTVLSRFDGNLDPLDFLRYDVTNIAHYLRPDARVLVVGSGGGRDILSALVFRQKEVLAVEINEAVLDAVHNRFGEFTGRLDKLPQVRIVHDEARSFISRSADAWDIIQISLIDTWAATAAGALSLTENGLYTIEAWQTMLDRLTAGGVLSVSRWYSTQNAMELQRSVALARGALARAGIVDGTNHILAATNINASHELRHNGHVTLLVSPTPFSAADVRTFVSTAAQQSFTILAAPGMTKDPLLQQIIAAKDLSAVQQNVAYNLTPPTDDNPFFFNLLRVQDLFSRREIPSRLLNANAKAVGMLYLLLLITIVLTYYTIVYPLRRRIADVPATELRSFTLYFVAIGLGYMLVEISQMQRLAIFLGHPVFSLTVVLSSLLLASGLGSFLSQRFLTRETHGRLLFVLLVAALVLFGIVSPPLISSFRAATTPLRIITAFLLVSPLGLLMGCAFPLGMNAAQKSIPRLAPWLWGVNGAASVVSSVLAAVISLSCGISWAFWAGTACYVAAGLFHQKLSAKPVVSG